MLKNNYLIKIIFIIILITLSILITGCSNNEGGLSQVSNYNVNFSVLDESDDPIEGATVTLVGSSKTTDSNGVVTFSKPDGSYDYNVTFTGYESVYDTAIVDGNDVSIDVPMTILITTYNITFTIIDNSDNPINDAKITLEGEDKNTDGNGMATFNKKDGTYNYTVTATDYVDITNESITVDGSDLTKTVKLQDAPPAGYIGIYNWEDLYDIREDLYGDYILMNDLDSTSSGYDTLASSSANNGKGWLPIGDSTNKFEGKFDGNDFTISDLFINRPNDDYIGLFGFGYSVKLLDIIIDSIDISGESYVGSIIGYKKGDIGGSNDNIIKNCHVTGSVNGNSYTGGLTGGNNRYSVIRDSTFNGQITGIKDNMDSDSIGGIIGGNYGQLYSNSTNITLSVDGKSYNIGGIAGHNKNSITNCYSEGTIKITSNNGESFGGLVGQNDNPGLIEDSYSTVAVNASGTDPRYVGGLVGYNNYIIKQSYSTGDVTGDDYCGGLVGHSYKGNIDKSFATGNVSGGNFLGGLAGYFGTDSIEESHVKDSYALGDVTGLYSETTYGYLVGGLIGRLVRSDIENSYSVGLVTGQNDMGGLIGDNFNNYGNVINSYYDLETSGQSDTGKGSPRTTKQMQEGSADTTIDGDPMYTSWETTIWDFGSDTDYPSLSWE